MSETLTKREKDKVRGRKTEKERERRRKREKRKESEKVLKSNLRVVQRLQLEKDQNKG